MASKTSKSGVSHKITFGKRRNGKHKKTKSPKDKPVSKYVGQGRR